MCRPLTTGNWSSSKQWCGYIVATGQVIKMATPNRNYEFKKYSLYFFLFQLNNIKLPGYKNIMLLHLKY